MCDFLNKIILKALSFCDHYIDAKDYKEKAESLRFQIVENWCLCKYCQLYDNNNTNFNHWLGELRAYINKLKFLNIKNNINNNINN